MSIDPKIKNNIAGKNMHSLVVLFYATGGVGQLLDNFPVKNIRIIR